MANSQDRRAFLRSGALLGVALPLFKFDVAFARTAPDPYLRYVNPEFRQFVAQLLPAMRNQPPLSVDTLAKNRAFMKNAHAPLLTDIPYETKSIPGAQGQPPVTIYVVNAKSSGQRPAILHTHGGGMVSGSAEGSIHDLQVICKALDCVAVTVEYRLAPETTYKGSIEDNYAGLKWLHNNAAQLGVDPNRIAVFGESAGGGHAAILAIVARDRKEVPIAFQCLIYPMLDDRTGSSRKVPDYMGQIIWKAGDNRFGWQSFLGEAPGGPTAPRYAVPARVSDLSGLPPTFIGVGSIDLFADEDMDYAKRLSDAGVATQLVVVPGAFHGFDIMPVKSELVTWFNMTKIDALRRGLGLA